MRRQLGIELNPPTWNAANYSVKMEQKTTLFNQVMDDPEESKKFLDCESRNFLEIETEEQSTMSYDSDPALENLTWEAMFPDIPAHRYNPHFALFRTTSP